MAHSQLTDEQLVMQIGRGRMQALAELVKRHQRRALQLAYRSLGDWHLAEDVVQESFLRVNRAAPKYRPEARFTTWFYRIVINLCMDELRKSRRRAEASTQAAAETIQSTEDPTRRQEATEVHQAVHRALDRLNERERLAVILHRFEGQSHRQITETTASAVESLLVRAYRKLREDLAPLASNLSENPQAADGRDVQ